MVKFESDHLFPVFIVLGRAHFFGDSKLYWYLTLNFTHIYFIRSLRIVKISPYELHFALEAGQNAEKFHRYLDWCSYINGKLALN